ncbi:MAG: DNA sulfur modification protein DndD [Bacteroidales bacterium]|jgi:DNA sulfur modification protein DndD|nr:DNA sulfur modification protein DndD [Bacteroidales bacterium]
MKFSKIRINNFRQYYGNVELDLSTSNERNIVLIGGKNGYGKTNLLLSIVWCLYGDKIAQIDDHFKKEIQKEKSYPAFIQQSLNWSAQEEGNRSFSVGILIEDVELPGIEKSKSTLNKIFISRERNTITSEEKLSIKDSLSGKEIFDNESDIINYINDFIIPIEAAKFVFFDAEKIAEIANFSIKEEGNFINDALGRILGLDIYQTLIEDLKDYINTLKREGATKSLQEQIINYERGIDIAKLEIEQLEENSAEQEKDIDKLRNEIRYCEGLITQNSKEGNSAFDREKISIEIKNLEELQSVVSERFNDLSEIIPIAILTGKLEEVKEHLDCQDQNELLRNSNNEISEKVNNFIDMLFNRPPEPENSTMSFVDKNFYYEKAKRLGSEIFTTNKDFVELPFEHDLNNAEKKLILDSIVLINTQNDNQFKDIIQKYNKNKNELIELNKILNKIDANLEDDIVFEYIERKKSAEHKIGINNRKIGENNQEKNKLLADIKKHEQQLTYLRGKVKIDERNRRKIQECEKFITVLTTFLEEQKNWHKSDFEKTILEELRYLMHKLSIGLNNSEFIQDVKATILASGQGMMISLFNKDGDEIRKESLSSGEKQIYISSLIKAILKESIQDLPVFIDTPLGRLDEEHRENFINKYYPRLAKQVVLFSTNSEITSKKHNEISNFIAKSYILVNDGANTRITEGYF